MQAKKEPSGKQHEIAALLLGLSSLPFTQKINAKSGYIALELKLGKSNRNKNAVSVLKGKVSFMVPDWHAEDEARALGLETTRKPEIHSADRALRFTELSCRLIQDTQAFFKSMLEEANRESRHRQEN